MFSSNSDIVKFCFAPCPKYKVDAGQCSCHNRIMNNTDDFEILIKKAVRVFKISKILESLKEN